MLNSQALSALPLLLLFMCIKYGCCIKTLDLLAAWLMMITSTKHQSEEACLSEYISHLLFIVLNTHKAGFSHFCVRECPHKPLKLKLC